MQRYIVKESIKENKVILNKEDSYHIKTVMRNKIEDNIELVIKNSVYVCKIVNIDKNVTVELIESVNSSNELPCHVVLAQSLVNEQKMDYILQKSCELGISEIIPINTSRSIVKLDKKEEKKIIRWNRILKEASEQSKRNKIPAINQIMTIKDITQLNFDILLLCTVNEEQKSIKNELQNIKSSDRILFVVGPEGGFTKEEENLMITNGFVPVSLGRRVLRTETASSFVLSAINYELMR